MYYNVHAQKYVKPGAYQLGELSLELELESVSNRITMYTNYLLTLCSKVQNLFEILTTVSSLSYLHEELKLVFNNMDYNLLILGH